METYVILGGIMLMSFALYKVIDTWYIEPYEDLKVKYEVAEKEYKAILTSKNEYINKNSIEIEKLKAKLREVRAKSKIKSKVKKTANKGKILEKFDASKV